MTNTSPKDVPSELKPTITQKKPLTPLSSPKQTQHQSPPASGGSAGLEHMGSYQHSPTPSQRAPAPRLNEHTGAPEPDQRQEAEKAEEAAFKCVLIFFLSQKSKKEGKIFFWRAVRRPTQCQCFVYYPAISEVAKAWVYLGTSQIASTVSLNSNTTKCSVLSQHGNIVSLNDYYCLLQAWACGLKN